MKLKTRLNGKTFEFRDVKDVLAKANEPKSADRFQGIAAETVTERIAAKVVLSNLTVSDITENPVVPYEKDEVTRVELDALNQRVYGSFKNMTIGEVREWIMNSHTTKDDLYRGSFAFNGETVAAIAKICSTSDLIYGASKASNPTRCVTQIGLPGTLSYRCQTNSTTDDVDSILFGVKEGVSFGSGDACIGINPVEDTVETTRRIADCLWGFMQEWKVPTQLTVLSHVTTQMQSVREGAPLSMFFQSIAGTQAACDDFGVSRDLLLEAYDLAAHECTGTGANRLYFETGQGSEVSIGADEGADEMTLEGRTYGFARFFRPFMVNNVSGFIGPETIYDGREMIRANLEDHFMAKIIGLPMGMAPCYTNHTGIDQNDQEIACLLLNAANCNYYMGVPMGDDVMLSYQDVSFHDDATMRELSHRKPAPEFHKWAIDLGIMDAEGHLTDMAGNAAIFFK
ncbi:MAG TPA: ethanolamine ammonia-lyase subunit EutB [Oscillospiraceae bacterium]|nr:ethanolamine ammonia-lyase subunit EutB [Oscillospiraceae bacterium]HNW04517.1 ethanolamine ammonia-lyase subunit EutB [Oscillospiraceae bacterium]